IKRAWWRMGIGGRLIDAAEQWATQNQVHRLELTVRADNQRAIALYESKGFSIEGKKRDALYVNDAYVDEFYMGKLLATASS
ncbi:MAG: GNAT family N-acetyltransferase, partial [Chromatiales bacterium]|nr:GNAT family N-acetyltransferase [Chromatiales bacterium]